MSILGSGIENTNISYILPYAKCDLELTTGEQGLLSAISYFGIVFTSHMWGFLADTWYSIDILSIKKISTKSDCIVYFKGQKERITSSSNWWIYFLIYFCLCCEYNIDDPSSIHRWRIVSI